MQNRTIRFLIYLCLIFFAAVSGETESTGIIQLLKSFFVSGKSTTYARTSLSSLFGLSSQPTTDHDEGKAEMETLDGMDAEDQASVESSLNELLNRNWESVVTNLLPIVEKYPTSHIANAAVGAALLALGRHDYAESFLFTAVRSSNWTDSSSIGNLVEALRLSSEDDNTLLELAEKVAVHGLNSLSSKSLIDESGVIAHALASIYFERKNYTAASDFYLSAALQQQTVADPELWLKAATVKYFPTVDLKLAENVLQQALEYIKDNADLYFHLGLVLLKTNRAALAVPLFENALTLNQDHGDCAASLATAFHLLGRFDEALETYKLASSLSPSNHLLLANYATLLCSAEMNRGIEGMEVVQRAASVDARNPVIKNALEQCSSLIASSNPTDANSFSGNSEL